MIPDVRVMSIPLIGRRERLNRRIGASALTRRPVPRSVLLRSIVAFTVLPIGCHNLPTDLVSTGAILYGKVINSSGVPIAGTTLTVDLLLRACPGVPGALTTMTVLSDGSGGYRAQLVIGNVTGAQCAHVVASKGSTSVDKDVNVNVHTAPFDSTQVDLVLPGGA